MAQSDTSPEDEQRLIEKYRNMSVTEKFGIIAELNRAEAERQKASIRAQYGEISDEEMRMRLGAFRLGRELMIKVTGWDPAGPYPPPSS